MKFTLMTDRNGVPLAITLAGANRRDQRAILPVIENEFPHVGGPSRRPQIGPDEIDADAGYDSEVTRDFLRCFGMKPFIRTRGDPHGSQLGGVCWVVACLLGRRAFDRLAQGASWFAIALRS